MALARSRWELPGVAMSRPAWLGAAGSRQNARSGQVPPGMARGRRDRQGVARSGQWWPGVARSGQESPGVARIGREPLGVARNWQGVTRTGRE